ncbi:MAG: hypothetical protein IPH84_01565 [Bacteroidales bacterium]|nr:hypothetical protein [Bacteroidales bacterium]
MDTAVRLSAGGISSSDGQNLRATQAVDDYRVIQVRCFAEIIFYLNSIGAG